MQAHTTTHERVPLWSPSRERQEKSTMWRFARWVEERSDLALPDYRTLHSWSVEHLAEFWGSVWEYFDVQASNGSTGCTS